MKIKSLAVAAAIVATVGVTGVPAANAALSQCTGSKTCIWGNNDFDFALDGKDPNLGTSRLAAEDDNRMDSWANRSNGNTSGFDDPTPDGDSDGCQTWNRLSNDNNVGPGFSDQVSSWRTTRGC